MRTQKILQSIIVLIVVCSAKQIVKSPTLGLSVLEAQFFFAKQFCSRCHMQILNACPDSIEYISSLPEAGNFNLSASPISKNPYNITIIDVYTFETNQTYRFPNRRQLQKNHSSILYVPSGGAKLRGVIIYFHSSTQGKWNPPSSNGKEYQAIAGLYASQGYAVLIPDLLGYRTDSDPPPFLIYPQIAVRSAVSTLNQLVSFFRPLFNGKPSLYTIGYGEGGNYAAWFSKCISYSIYCPYYTLYELPQYSLSLNLFYSFKAAAVMEGALDLSEIMYNFLTKDVGININDNEYMIKDQTNHNFAKVSILIPLLKSFIKYSFNETSKFQNYINHDFFLMNCNKTIDQDLCNINENHYNISSVLNFNYSQTALSFAIGFSSLAKQYQGYQSSYLGTKVVQYAQGQTNSVLSLASSQIILHNLFIDAFKSASIVDYSRLVSTPLYLWTLTYDSVISSNNTRNFYKTGKQNQFISFYEFDNANYQVCEVLKDSTATDHFRAEIVANIFALNFIQKYP